MSDQRADAYPVPPEAVRMLLDRLFYPAPNTVPVIHPSFKALGRIWVPWPVLSHTSGLDRVMQNHPHAPSMCVLYQSGKCFSHEKCNQIHVHRQWATTVWHALELASANNCCRNCGDLPSLSHELFQALHGQEVSLRVPGAPPFAIPVEQLAATRFWQRFLDEERTNLYFNPDRVCMLHQQSVCKYGVECKNVHLCRNVWREMIKTIKQIPGVAFNEQWEVPTPDLETSEVPLPDPQLQAFCPMQSRLAIVHPHSGQEIDFALQEVESHDVADEYPYSQPQVSWKRRSHALSIVDPRSGEEVALAPVELKLEKQDLALPISPDDFDCGHTGVECASAVLDEEEEELHVKGEPLRNMENKGEFIGDSELSSKATPWYPRLALDMVSDASPDASSGGTPVSPSSSIGSDNASNVSNAFLSLGLAAKHGAAKWKHRPRDANGLEGVEAKLWAQKIEANRGLFKKITHGMLGVVLTEGPKTTGFGAGRGSLLP